MANCFDWLAGHMSLSTGMCKRSIIISNFYADALRVVHAGWMAEEAEFDSSQGQNFLSFLEGPDRLQGASSLLPDGK
jgi:hypothetical protein